MNNDLEQFSVEHLKEILDEDINPLNGFSSVPNYWLHYFARIALAAKQAKPVAQVYQPANIGICAALGPAIRMINVGLPAGTLLYTTPPANSPVIPDGWKLVPIEPTQGMVDAHISGMQSAGFSRAYRDMLASAPKPDGTLISEGTKNDSCQWNRDEDSVYSTGCGNEWQFTDGGLEDNKIKFCPYCSGKIAATKPESE